jgi:Family of unknown function (DUF6159)
MLAAINARTSVPYPMGGGAGAPTGGNFTWTCSTCSHTNAMAADSCLQCGTSFTVSLRNTKTSPGAAIAAMSAEPPHGFFGRVGRGFRLIKVSWSVLRLDPELMLFPLLAGLLTFGFVWWYLSAVHGVGLSDWTDETLFDMPKWELWIYYAVAYTIGVYFQAAVVACAMIRFKGGNPTLADGFSAAGRKFLKLTGWALIAATVALLIRWLEEFLASKAGRYGRAATRLLDLAWQVATYFAVPVILFENVPATSAVKRSGSLFRKTWKETLAGTLGMGAAFTIVYLAVVLLTIGMAVYVGPVAVVFGVCALIATIVIAYTLSAILNAALYRYATSGEPPVPFTYSDVGARYSTTIGAR